MYRQVMLCLALFLVGAYGQVLNTTKLVYTNQGAVRGHRDPNYDVFTFYNIPYATTPTGVDKFKAPLPPPSWNGTFNAIDRGIICHQLTGEDVLVPAGTTMHEDCLVANVYVPDTQDIDLPVLVNIHGGAFATGYGAMKSPIALVNSKKIIAVTFNYRLGIQGFLCLGTEVAPGNAGMKDQVALLRWVRDNIARFGGDPEEVTIAGCSAGGSSVETLLLSNTTRGLFHKVIAESACSLSPAIQFDPLQNAIDHAVLLNFTNSDNITALGEFYASISVENLSLDTSDYLNSKNSYFYFVPCVERNVGQEIFLDKGPLSVLNSSDLRPQPILYGFATMEGLLRINQFSQWIQAMNTNFSDFLTLDLMFESEQQRQQVANEIKEFYFGTGAVTTSHVLEYIDFFSDVLFIHSILRAIPYHVSAGNNQVYFYEYAFAHNNSIVLPFTNVTGPGHCEQHGVALGFLINEDSSEELMAMSKLMGEMYINFITTGNPNSPGTNSSFPFWPPVGLNRYPYMHVDSNITLVSDGHPIREALANRTRFWDNVYEQYGTRIPIPPSFSASPNSVASNKLWIVLCAILALLRFK